jgi:hypothetical protein
MKAKLRRVDGRVRLEVKAQDAEERQLLHRFCEMLNDNRSVLVKQLDLFDTPLRVESFGIDYEDPKHHVVGSIAIESAFLWPFRNPPKR